MVTCLNAQNEQSQHRQFLTSSQKKNHICCLCENQSVTMGFHYWVMNAVNFTDSVYNLINSIRQLLVIPMNWNNNNKRNITSITSTENNRILKLEPCFFLTDCTPVPNHLILWKDQLGSQGNVFSLFVQRASCPHSPSAQDIGDPPPPK